LLCLRKFILMVALTILILSPTMARFYQITELDTGWTTGLRQSLNTSVNISGDAIGEGTYYRYTEMDFNDVRMAERISAANGTMDTGERIRLESRSGGTIELVAVKNPGDQNYTLTVNETWPVAVAAARSMDYIGKGISDRESFGNNLDYVGASFYGATDLKKERTCYLELKSAWFEGYINNTTKVIYYDHFRPSKITEYSLNSRSTGLAVLDFRQSKDRYPVNEGEESYHGSYSISRKISMSSSRYNITDIWAGSLECCLGLDNRSLLERRVFGSDIDCLYGCS
jgi:hypothetical protein